MGSAIGCANGASPTITGCTFERNVAENYGGAIYFGYYSSLRIIDCTFSQNTAFRSGASGGGAIACYTYDATSVVSHCTFVDNAADSSVGGAIEFGALDSSGLVLSHCTLSGNWAPTGSGTLCRGGARVAVNNTIIASGIEGEGLACSDTATAALTCCDVYGNEGGDWVGCIEDQFPGNDNFHDDPMFCGSANPQYPYTLSYESPLLSASGTCGQIGAWWAGCGGVSEVRADNASQSTWVVSPLRPNPFTRATKFMLDAPPSGGMSVNVYDSSGRHVRVLESLSGADGSRVVVWDGTDDRGQLQHSGIYFVRILAGGISRERSVLLIR